MAKHSIAGITDSCRLVKAVEDHAYRHLPKPRLKLHKQPPTGIWLNPRGPIRSEHESVNHQDPNDLLMMFYIHLGKDAYAKLTQVLNAPETNKSAVDSYAILLKLIPALRKALPYLIVLEKMLKKPGTATINKHSATQAIIGIAVYGFGLPARHAIEAEAQPELSGKALTVEKIRAFRESHLQRTFGRFRGEPTGITPLISQRYAGQVKTPMLLPQPIVALMALRDACELNQLTTKPITRTHSTIAVDDTDNTIAATVSRNGDTSRANSIAQEIANDPALLINNGKYAKSKGFKSWLFDTWLFRKLGFGSARSKLTGKLLAEAIVLCAADADENKLDQLLEVLTSDKSLFAKTRLAGNAKANMKIAAWQEEKAHHITSRDSGVTKGLVELTPKELKELAYASTATKTQLHERDDGYDAEIEDEIPSDDRHEPVSTFSPEDSAQPPSHHQILVQLRGKNTESRTNNGYDSDTLPQLDDMRVPSPCLSRSDSMSSLSTSCSDFSDTDSIDDNKEQGTRGTTAEQLTTLREQQPSSLGEPDCRPVHMPFATPLQTTLVQ